MEKIPQAYLWNALWTLVLIQDSLAFWEMSSNLWKKPVPCRGIWFWIRAGFHSCLPLFLFLSAWYLYTFFELLSCLLEIYFHMVFTILTEPLIKEKIITLSWLVHNSFNFHLMLPERLKKNKCLLFLKFRILLPQPFLPNSVYFLLFEIVPLLQVCIELPVIIRLLFTSGSIFLLTVKLNNIRNIL